MTITNDFFNRLPGVWENKLDGQWQDDFGWNFISQPKLNASGSSDFEMRFDQMRETITFKTVGDPARNIGTTGKAGFWQAMSYEISIQTPAGEGIHHEIGHFLLNVLENGETQENLRGKIIRQASIPRANVMLTTGELEPGTIAEAIANQNTPFYNAKPQVNDDAMQKLIDTEIADKQVQVTKLGGPNLAQPLEWLKTKLGDNPVDQDWVFGFRHDRAPSQMVSGQLVAGPVSIGNLLSDFWIAKRDLNGKTIDILKYAQKVDVKFHDIAWPHTAVNTLVKQ